jgi:hypothetical protein
MQVGLRHEGPKPNNGANALGFAALTPTYLGYFEMGSIHLFSLRTLRLCVKNS